MPQTATLGAVIENFIKTNPNYIPNLSDLDICARYIAQNFARITYSFDSAFVQRGLELQKYQIENKNLRAENDQLKKKLKK